MDEEGFWESLWRRLDEVYGPDGELGDDAPVQIGEGSHFGTPNYAEREWSGPPPEPFYPNQRGMPPSGPKVAVRNYEAQNPTPLEEKEEYMDWMNQLLMSALMAKKKPTSGRQAPTSYGVGAQVTPGDPWTMRADWEDDYRYLK